MKPRWMKWRAWGWVAALAAVGLEAAALRIDAVVFAGGGSAGRSARFRVDGSIGQGVAESESGDSGRFGVRAGFWSQVLPWTEPVEPEQLDWSVELVPGESLRIRLRSVSVPGRAYTIESTENLGGVWRTIGRPAAGADGVVVFDQLVTSGRRFYRVTD